MNTASEIVRELNDNDNTDMTTLTAFLLLGFTMLKNVYIYVLTLQGIKQCKYCSRPVQALSSRLTVNIPYMMVLYSHGWAQKHENASTLSSFLVL
jgi:hypothetical protein